MQENLLPDERVETSDPLSPFLFTLVMEHLSQSLKDQKESGEMKTYKLGGAKAKYHQIYVDYC